MKKNTICFGNWWTILVFTILCSQANASFGQSINAVVVSTPVCKGGTGSVVVSFNSGTTYPFTLDWYGSNIQYGSVTITGNPQTIALTGNGYNYSAEGMKVSFYTNSSTKFLGEYPVGITFDKMSQQYTATCSAGVSFNFNNIKGGSSPYSVMLYDRVTSKTVASGANPLSVGFSTACTPNYKNYQLILTDNNGCSVSVDSIYINCQGLDVGITSTQANCTNGTASITSVAGGTAPYSYLWSNGNTSTGLSGLVKGNYSCTVTDATGCSGAATAYVTQAITINTNTSSSTATCNNSDGKSTVFASGGKTPYTYLWDNGETTASATKLKPENHEVIVTDANGCIGEGYVWINSVSPVYAYYNSNPSNCTSASGSASITVSGGTAPYTYLWHGLSSSSNTITGMAPGEYSFLVTDAKGCQRSGVVVIPPKSQISSTPSIIHAVCPSNKGSIQLSTITTAPPVSYKWSNGATTSSISNVNTGYYTCQITDANGCIINKGFSINYASPISIHFTTTDASCIYASDGIISASVLGGQTPFKYNWSNGATTQTVSGLPAGRYYLTVTDANGCSGSSEVLLGYNAASSSCYCTISGVVFDDQNNNCVKDAGESGIANVLIHNVGNQYTSTDNNGYYSFKVPIGAYTIAEILDKAVSLSSCQSNNVAVNVTSVGGACQKTVDFANQLTPMHDIQIFTVSVNAPIPGQNYIEKLIIKNNGNSKESAVAASYRHDGQLTWLNGNTSPYLKSGSNYYTLNPTISILKSDKYSDNLSFFTPTNLPLGTQVFSNDSAAYQKAISNYWVTNEETPWNNIYEDFTTVRSSYDPNYKEVFPKGKGSAGNITTETKNFRYVIHFENNGTANAQKVVVVDTLDADLDIESFRLLDASHKVKANMDKNGILTFTFDNINLAYTPLGVYNEFAQGYVAYNIAAKSTVQVGTKLSGKADIYFDYNPGVPTNSTIHTYIQEQNASTLLKEQSPSLELYPNPATESLYLKMPTGMLGNKQIEIYNLQGQLLQSHSTQHSEQKLNIASLQHGVYLVKVQFENGASSSEKFVKQ